MGENQKSDPTEVLGLSEDQLAAAFELFERKRAAAAAAEKARRDEARVKREKLFADVKPFTTALADALSKTPLHTFFKHTKDATGRSVPTSEVAGYGYSVGGEVPVTIGDTVYTARVQVTVKINDTKARRMANIPVQVIPAMLEGLTD